MKVDAQVPTPVRDEVGEPHRAEAVAEVGLIDQSCGENGSTFMRSTLSTVWRM
jgi:hypothetical protein